MFHALAQFAQALVERFAPEGQLFLLDQLLAMVILRRHVFAQFRHAQVGKRAHQRARSKTVLQIAVHFADLAQFRGEEEERQVGLAANRGVGGQTGMRRLGIGGAKSFQAAQGLFRLGPALPVHMVE